MLGRRKVAEAEAALAEARTSAAAAERAAWQAHREARIEQQREAVRKARQEQQRTGRGTGVYFIDGDAREWPEDPPRWFQIKDGPTPAQAAAIAKIGADERADLDKLRNQQVEPRFPGDEPAPRSGRVRARDLVAGALGGEVPSSEWDD